MVKLSTFRSAIVVFGQVKALDWLDAMAAVERSVRQAMKSSELKGIPHSPNATHRGLWLPATFNTPHPPIEVEILDYSELNTAMMSGKVVLTPNVRGRE